MAHSLIDPTTPVSQQDPALLAAATDAKISFVNRGADDKVNVIGIFSFSDGTDTGGYVALADSIPKGNTAEHTFLGKKAITGGTIYCSINGYYRQVVRLEKVNKSTLHIWWALTGTVEEMLDF